MYLEHYGLTELPFELTPNPQFLFMTAQHREALANLQYGLSKAKAVTLLVGEAGMGKTTLLKAALGSELCAGVRAVHLTNPGLSREEFVETLARAFQLSDEARSSKATLLAELETQLLERRGRGEIAALVVDEAQRLSEELLEEVRLLANIETATEKLLPLVLSGQPELAERLNSTRLRQLKQRVALRCELRPLELADTAAYIATRIRRAGGEASRLFTREAVVLIHEISGGIPRTISVVCDNALLGGFAAGRHPVGTDLIKEVARDFDLKVAREPIEEPVPQARPAERPAGTELPNVTIESSTPTSLISSVAARKKEAEQSRTPPDEPGRRRSFSIFGIR
ncbi:MAG TPA: AAA family ATPase [Vicinamibacterales bacterium]|jgi:general secretion pathway protein A